MRELKFRVWDKKRKCYAERIQTLNTSCPYHDRMNMFKGVMTFAKWVLRRYILEQYTGLKDVNGNEITEGDILEDGEGEPFEYWVVKFKDGKFVGETQGVTEDLFELTDLEIVGTIREHPEFLEEKE